MPQGLIQEQPSTESAAIPFSVLASIAISIGVWYAGGSFRWMVVSSAVAFCVTCGMITWNEATSRDRAQQKTLQERRQRGKRAAENLYGIFGYYDCLMIDTSVWLDPSNEAAIRLVCDLLHRRKKPLNIEPAVYEEVVRAKGVKKGSGGYGARCAIRLIAELQSRGQIQCPRMAPRHVCKAYADPVQILIGLDLLRDGSMIVLLTQDLELSVRATESWRKLHGRVEWMPHVRDWVADMGAAGFISADGGMSVLAPSFEGWLKSKRRPSYPPPIA